MKLPLFLFSFPLRNTQNSLKTSWLQIWLKYKPTYLADFRSFLRFIFLSLRSNLDLCTQIYTSVEIWKELLTLCRHSLFLPFFSSFMVWEGSFSHWEITSLSEHAVSFFSASCLSSPHFYLFIFFIPSFLKSTFNLSSFFAMAYEMLPTKNKQ